MIGQLGNRMIGLVAGDSGRTQAIRVRLASLPAPWDAWDDTTLWVLEPEEICAQSGIGPGQDCPGGSFYKVAGLTCDQAEAHFTDWAAEGTVYLHHPGIVPDGLYDVQLLDETCNAGLEAGFSPVLSVPMSAFGDISGLFDPTAGEHGVWVAPDNNVGIGQDVLAAIAAFSNRPGNVGKTRADIEPCLLDFRVNISDIVKLLDAFRALPYPFVPGLGDCPSDPCGG